LEDGTLKPQNVPPVLPLTQEEVTLYENAIKRRELRLVLSGRMKPNQATELKNMFES